MFPILINTTLGVEAFHNSETRKKDMVVGMQEEAHWLI